MIELKKTPDVEPEKQAGQFLTAIRELGAAGFEHYEISSFARPGREAGTTAHTGNQKDTWVWVPPRIHLMVPAGNGILPIMQFISKQFLAADRFLNQKRSAPETF